MGFFKKAKAPQPPSTTRKTTFKDAAPDRAIPRILEPDKAYVRQQEWTVSGNGEKKLDRRFFYGDAATLVSFLSDVAEIEDAISASGVNGWQGVDGSLLKSLRAGTRPPKGDRRGYIEVTVNPPTATGKQPKNAAALLVDATDNHGNGSIWHVQYLGDGSINKAEVHYWSGHVRHSYDIRRSGDGLAVTRVVKQEKDGAETVLFANRG